MKSLQDYINAIHGPRVRGESPKTLDSTSQIEGTMWAKEMDICKLIDISKEEADNCNEVHIVEIGARKEEHLLRSFMSINNTERRQFRNMFALANVVVMKTPLLDSVMTSQCLKNTKVKNKSLAHVQALMLDAIGPLTDTLEKLNLEESKIAAEEIGYAVESTVTLLGNALSQMSTLQR